MNVRLPDPSKNEGSSLILAILVGVAAIVVIALMIQTTSEDGKKGREEKQRDAIAETMDVFNKFDSIIESSSDEARSEKPAKGGEPSGGTNAGASKGPMQLITPPPPDVDQGEGGKPQASIFFDGFGTGGDDMIFAKEVESAYGALDVITGFNLSAEKETVPNEPAMPEVARGEGVLAPLNAEGVVPESRAPVAMMPTPKLPEVDPRSSSGVESAVARLADLASDSDLDVALREAVAVKEGFSAAAEVSPVNRLSAPLFSHPAGSFSSDHFNIELKLANPNPKRISRIRYSINGERWSTYEGGAIAVPPGTNVNAYCESLDRAWGDSAKESREFLEQTFALTPPTIHASAPTFDKDANQRISIAIKNPNRNAASRVEYRFGGSPWQVYRESVKIDGAVYGRSGVSVEARVVGVIGVAGRQASDSVVLEVAPAGGRDESVAVEDAPQRDSIIALGNVDLSLSSPDRPHGYSAQGLTGIEFTSATDSDGGDRSLLEMFEASRKLHEEPKGQSIEPTAGGDRWGQLGTLMPDEGVVARGSLPGNDGNEGVLDGSAVSLFESAVVP